MTRSIHRARENMWITLTLVICAAYPAQTKVLHEDTGAIHIHKKASSPLPEKTPLQPVDIEATKTAEAFVKNLLPELDIRVDKSLNSIILEELNAVFTLTLNNLVLKGFKQASLDNLVLRMSNSRVDFNATVPFLFAGGTVFVNGVIDAKSFAIIGNLSTFLDNVKISGILKIQKQPLYSQQDVLQITDADIAIDISDIMIEITLVEELVLFKLTLMKFMNKPEDDIVNSIYRAAVKLINKQLAKIPADAIINILVPSSQRRAPSVRMAYPYEYGYIYI